MSLQADEALTDSLTSLQKYKNLKPIHESSAYSFENMTTGYELSDLKSSTCHQIAFDSQLNQSYVSEMEKTILRSFTPITLDENEEITILGQKGLWANKQEEINWKGNIPLSNYKINEDQEPEIIKKKSNQAVEYIQELAIRYLRPPTPPSPGEIIIQQQPDVFSSPAPPLIIRQQPARPATPEPLVIREAPPQQPELNGKKIITISGKKLPPPPRKVIIERLAPLPKKPQSVIIERWLPYPKLKRKVVFQKASMPNLIIENPKNLIVQWQSPKVIIKKEVNYLGVIRANPIEYVKRYENTLKSAKELPEFVTEIKTPQGIVLAADCQNYAHELEGDLHALKLVNLDKEGLTEYKPQLEKIFNGPELDVKDQKAQLLTFLSDLFAQIDHEENEVLSYEEAKKLYLKFKHQMGKECDNDEVEILFKNLKEKFNESLSLNELKKVFEDFF